MRVMSLGGPAAVLLIGLLGTSSATRRSPAQLAPNDSWSIRCPSLGASQSSRPWSDVVDSAMSIIRSMSSTSHPAPT
jgi:hypothetical protein